jgi:amino acid transporter
VAATGPARVLVATTAMLAFISFWRAAAVVLNDLGSSAFYAGAIAEQAIGRAAPWFILAIMLFSYCVRSLYIESCSMFVRGGVYRVVKEAMGSTLAKFSVSALMFDYILTGPISGVSAGQYLVGFLNDLLRSLHVQVVLPTDATAAFFAVLVTVYFWWENVKGIPESSEKALRIMYVTTVMVVLMIAWCAYTIWVRGAIVPLPGPASWGKARTLITFESAGIPAEAIPNLTSPLRVSFDNESTDAPSFAVFPERRCQSLTSAPEHAVAECLPGDAASNQRNRSDPD